MKTIPNTHLLLYRSVTYSCQWKMLWNILKVAATFHLYTKLKMCHHSFSTLQRLSNLAENNPIIISGHYKLTEHVSVVVSTHASYSECPGPESWLKRHYHDWGSEWFTSVPPCICYDSTLKNVMAIFLPVHHS